MAEFFRLSFVFKGTRAEAKALLDELRRKHGVRNAKIGKQLTADEAALLAGAYDEARGALRSVGQTKGFAIVPLE
ncbi:hypothetical protein ABIF68_006357 [Bradyrhizobium japonicum]|jgi:hypothetical protein|uniref:Uncharacterized protein n=1 Tax=Bradyrhizobium barranii subsp. barranii TaxID=2823807 RepID=A0A7Z0TS17_9BRAD|nr:MULTISPECIES: hypothetical protein [Bradyrhizobium]UEM17024.1 hypothetical protein J4G43_024040 [Bradyrhizobium barranii subsp. barranii]UGX98741.1 hypothetical protein G6321_00027955 [Bradyrhizobium barranii subsp. barranii]